LLKKLTGEMKSEDKDLIGQMLSRVDMKHLHGDKAAVEQAYLGIIKSLHFLGFFDDAMTVQMVDAHGKPRLYIDVFGGVMADKMTHGDTDRDLVVMRHNFILEDQNKKRWKHTSTMIDSGQSFKSGGNSLMSQTVGITTAIGTRLVLTGKISRKGVVSPIYKDIYDPILKELERFGIVMIEASERPDLMFQSKL